MPVFWPFGSRAKVSNFSDATNQYLKALPSWQAQSLETFRRVIHEVCPGINEEIKWGVPVFVYKSKTLFSMGSFKDYVKYNFMYNGAMLKDTHSIFNNGLESKKSRSIDLKEGQFVAEDHLKDLVAQSINILA